MSLARGEHNSEVGCAGEVRLIPELARGMLFSGLSPRNELPGAYNCKLQQNLRLSSWFQNLENVKRL